MTKMSKAQLGNSNDGTVRLTLIAAAAHLHDNRVKEATLSDLAATVPELRSLSAIRKWMYPQSNLFGYEPLFEGLRLAAYTTNRSGYRPNDAARKLTLTTVGNGLAV